MCGCPTVTKTLPLTDPQKPAANSRSSALEEKFKATGEALEILTDPMKRKLYDEGYDKEAIEERVRAAERAARGENHHHHH